MAFILSDITITVSRCGMPLIVMTFPYSRSTGVSRMSTHATASFRTQTLKLFYQNRLILKLTNKMQFYDEILLVCLYLQLYKN